MKLFFKNIALSGIVLIAVLFVEDAITTYAFHNKQTRKYAVWNDIIHESIETNVLIMGNSRAWCQYSPKIIDSALGTCTYNIGIDGSCFNRQIARYEIYRHYQKSLPKYIIQNVEFFTLGHTQGYEREQFMPYLMYLYFRERISDEEPLSFGELYITMYRYYMNNVYDEYTKFDFAVERGYFGEDIDWDGSKTQETKPYNAEINTNTLNLFVRYIENVQSEGINLIFVLVPLYKDTFGKVLNINEIHSIYYGLAKKYDIPILDYSNCWLSQDTSYFYNASHMNKTGSELFTKQLCHDLDSLGIIPRQN